VRWPLLLCSLLAASSVLAESTAVLAVNGEQQEAALAAANDLRSALSESGATVLDADETRARLSQLGVSAGFELDQLQARIDAAETAQDALEVERSVEILEGVLRDLVSDAEFSEAKQRMHQGTRLRAATRLMALAGVDERGEAKTELGARALEHMVAAARVDPALTLSRQEHPPKMHRLLALAQAQLKEAGLGGLDVSSSPEGATVFVEGRPVGLTPLRLMGQLPYGSYRVWLEREDARSVTRRVAVGAQPARLEVDLAFEGALWADGPGLRPLPSSVVERGFVDKLTSLLDVERIVLIGRGGGVTWVAAASTRHDDIARGSVSSGDGDAARLAAWLAEGAGPNDDIGARVPRHVLPAPIEPLRAESEPDDATPWLIAGGVAAGVVALAAAGAGVVAVAALAAAPASGRFDLEIQP
jgi:hypothetical protein